MKQRMIQKGIVLKILYILCSGFLIVSCKTDQKATNKNGITIQDTIYTKSGLKYFYKVKGKGRKIEPGCMVTAVLSLKIKDKVIWTSYKEKDSSFSYIADKGGVIKGYNEMAMLLREGDDVVAILPDSLAYGKKGSGKVIPPNSTLVYDQFKIKYVGEPRLMLSDSLFHVLTNDGVDKMKAIYHQLTTTKDSILYHGGMGALNRLWRKLNKEEMYNEAFDAFSFFSKESEDSTLKFYVIRSLENQGKIQLALDKVTSVLKGRKLSAGQKEYYIKYKVDLRKKLKADN